MADRDGARGWSPAPGSVIGSYRLGRKIGSGGMGTVFLAEVEGEVEGTGWGETIAVKIVHPRLVTVDSGFKRFIREAEIGMRLQHPNVVRTLGADAVQHAGVEVHLIAMEYVEGQTLRSLLDELGRLPEELCRHVGREVARGLAAIHELGVVHRDVKPENVLISADEVVKLMDLGSARVKNEVSRISEAGQFVGSVLYAAPEQFRGGGEDVDGRADLYALGILLYELAAAEHPFPAGDVSVAMRLQLEEAPPPLAVANPQLSPFFEEVVERLLAKRRGDRFVSAQELLTVLEQGEESPWWRGRAKQIRIETNRPLRRINTPRETALHGREQEIRILNRIYRSAASGTGQVLLLEGEAGAGKTRLVDEFVRSLDRAGEPLSYLYGVYPAGGTATAVCALAQAFREHFGAADLQYRVETYLQDVPALAAPFAALLLGESGRSERPLTAGSLQTVLAQVTHALAAERPVILFVDDLHNAPAEGLALFAGLAAAVAGHALLLIGATGAATPEEWLAERARRDRATRMTIGRLGPNALGKLLVEAFQSERLAQELAFPIAQKSDGNPFFVFEIVRGLREGGFVLQRDTGTWTRSRTIDELEIPATVEELILGRLENLSREDRRLLEAASCCGYAFDPTLVAEALGWSPIVALRRLAFLEARRRLVASLGAHFEFDHHQIHGILYARLDDAARGELHAALGTTLERRLGARDRDPAELPGDVVAQLSRHLFRGGLAHEAERYLEAALDHFEASYENAAAVETAGAALDAEGLLTGVRRVDVLLRRARRLGFLGRREAELADLEEARSLADAVGDTERRARTRGLLGWHLANRSDYETARDLLTAAAEMALGESDRRELSATLGSLGRVHFALGDPDKAREFHERHLAMAREVVFEAGEAIALGSLGDLAFRLGDFETAAARFDEDLQLSRRLGDRRGEGIATGNLGRVEEARGRYADAIERFELSLGVARDVGYRKGQGVALGQLGRVHARVGALDRAQENLYEARALFREVAAIGREAQAVHRLATLLEATGRPDEAEQEFLTALEMRRAIRDRAGIAETLRALGAVDRVQWRLEEAQARLDEACSTALAVQDPDLIAVAAAERSLLPGEDGGRARTIVDEHIGQTSAFARIEARFLLWRGEHDAADLGEAHRLLAEVRAHAPERLRRGMVERVPLYRDVARAWEGLAADRG